MNPGPPASLSLRPCSRRRFRRWQAAFAVASLLAAVPRPAMAARSSARSAHFSPGVAGRPALPQFDAPSMGRQTTNSETAELNSLSQLDRLANPSEQNYDIVPPTHPDQAASDTLPGYEVVRLGRKYNNRLCLEGTVTGIRGLMMLDTGANNTALSDATYRSLLAGAAARLPTGLPRAVSLNGTNTPLAEATDFHVGKSNLGAVPVCLIPHHYLLDANPDDARGNLYDGLMGENILRHYNALVDCGRLMLYLNIDPARKLNLSSSFVRNGWTRVPMSDLGNDFTVPCVLNGHRFRLIVDTGSPFTNLDRGLLASAQVGSHDLPVRGGLIGTAVVRVGVVDLDRLQIGGYTAAGVRMTTTSQSLAAFGGRQDRTAVEPIVGLLGGDMLANNNAVIDIGKQGPLSETCQRQGGQEWSIGPAELTRSDLECGGTTPLSPATTGCGVHVRPLAGHASRLYRRTGTARHAAPGESGVVPPHSKLASPK